MYDVITDDRTFGSGRIAVLSILTILRTMATVGNSAYAAHIRKQNMTANVGGIDRIIRVVAGLAIIGAGVMYQSWWGVIGIVPLATAILRWCPPYTLLGISTCSMAAEETPTSSESQ